MRRTVGWSARFASILALALAFAGASFAQTSSTTATRKFEVISVDGNELVFRDERGTHQITVPDGFRFTVDGKQLAISDLKRGMKGTAVVTTTTTVTPVTLTEIKKGVVVGVGPDSLTVKDEADGVRKRFTQAQLNARGIKLVTEDGRVTYAADVKQGDAITAIIVSQASAGGGDGTGGAGDAGSGQPRRQPRRASRRRGPARPRPGHIAMASVPATDGRTGDGDGDGPRLGAGRVDRARYDGLGDHHPDHRRGAVLLLAPAQVAAVTARPTRHFEITRVARIRNAGGNVRPISRAARSPWRPGSRKRG